MKDPIIDGLSAAGIPFVPYSAELRHILLNAKTPDTVIQALGMKPHVMAKVVPAYHDAIQAVIVFPNSYACLTYKPESDDFDLLLHSKKTSAPMSEVTLGHVALDEMGVAMVTTKEVGPSLLAVSALHLNQPSRGPARGRAA